MRSFLMGQVYYCQYNSAPPYDLLRVAARCPYNRPIMRLADIGETGTIDMIARTIAERAGAPPKGSEEDGFTLIRSVGDDAAVWESGPGTRVLTTDAMVEGVHFRTDLASWREIGWKALTVNLSDVAAMGCQPRVSVVSLGLDPNLDVEAVTELYEGMLDACDVYGGEIVGGDIVSSPAIFVTVAMVGDASTIDGPVLDRGAASVGDLIGVTGALGDSAGGLRLLLAGDVDRDLGERSLALRHLRPSPRIEEGLLLRRLGVRAAMDISDGLIADLGKMCAASGVGALIDAGCVPGGEELRRTFPDDWTDLALAGGEDYELVFTAPQAIMASAQRMLETPVTVIGRIVDGEGVEIVGQSDVGITDGGWDHFRSRTQ